MKNAREEYAEFDRMLLGQMAFPTSPLLRLFDTKGDVSGLVRLPYQHQKNQPLANKLVPSTEPAVPPNNDSLDVKQAAKLIGMSAKWLYRSYRNLPHVLIPAGRKPRIRFRRSQLEAWIESHSFDSRKKGRGKR